MINKTKSILTLVAILTASSISSSQAQSWLDFFRTSKPKPVQRIEQPRRAPAPVVCEVAEPVYIDQLETRITRIDKLAHDMLTTYRGEVADFPGCDYSMALLDEMKIHCVNARKLIKAHKGSSKKDFLVAACDVRDSLVKMEKLHKKAIVSNYVCKLIELSDRPVTFVVAIMIQ